MAAADPAMPLPLGGAPQPLQVEGAVAPQLPFGPDPGSITGWILQETSSVSTNETSLVFERSFARLPVVPMPEAEGHDNAMRSLTDEVLTDDALGTYFVASNTPTGEPRITVLHSLARYSAGFGGQAALHGRVLGLMGEMVGDQLSMMIRFRETVTENLAHAFALENVTIQPVESIAAHFAGPNASVITDGLAVANGGVITPLCCLCPLPLAWAPYFLDFKTPFEAYTMGISLLATLANNVEKGRAMPFVDWLRASTQRFGQGPQERNVSVLDQPLDAAMPTPRVVHWMKGRLSHFRPAMPNNLAGYGGNQQGHPGPVELPPYPQSASQGTSNSLLELGKIHWACFLEDAEFDTEKPDVYGCMLTEGRKTIARIRALLEDIAFAPSRGNVRAVDRCGTCD